MTDKPIVRFKGKIFKEVKHLSIEDLKELFEGNAQELKSLVAATWEAVLENVLFISVVELKVKSL